MSEVVVRATGLTRDFGATRAVDGLDLTISSGTVYGLLGPNGSGKTTAMRMLTGLLRPSGGSAEVLGVHLPGRAEPLKRSIGYMTQAFSHYGDLTVLENLRFVADVYGLAGRRRAARIAEVMETYDLRRQAHQMAGRLSGGQRQRLALAAAVIHRPRLLFLDEPTAAVDPETRRSFWEQLFDLVDAGASLIVSTHFMDEAERCHRIAILDQGRKRADGTPRELMAEVGHRVFEIEGEGLRAIGRDLKQAPGILSVAQIGARLRVLTAGDGADELARVTALLPDRPDLAVRRAPVNLEDVFVFSTQDAEAAA